jgi:hypothetical protein
MGHYLCAIFFLWVLSKQWMASINVLLILFVYSAGCFYGFTALKVFVKVDIGKVYPHFDMTNGCSAL